MARQDPVRARLTEFEAAMAAPGVAASEFRTLFNDAPVGIAFVAEDGTYMKVNAEYCEILGYAYAELVARKRFQDVTHPEDCEAVEAECADVVAGAKRNYRMAKRYIHKRGHVVPIDLTVDRVDDVSGAFVHFVAHAVPIRLSEDFYRLQQNGSGVAPSLVPFYPLTRLLKDNWKVVGVALLTFFTSAGGVIRNYYLTAAQLETQTKQLEAASKDLQELRDENRRREGKIEELTRELRDTTRALKALPKE